MNNPLGITVDPVLVYDPQGNEWREICAELQVKLAESNDLLVEANSCFDQAVSIIEKLRKVVPKLVEDAEGWIKQ